MKNFILLIFSIFFCHLVNAQNWAPLGEGLNNLNSLVELFSFDNKLFAGGYFTEAGDVQASGVAYYSENKWHVVDPSNNTFAEVRNFENLHGNLYGFVPYETINTPSTKLMVKLNPESYKWQIVENASIEGSIDDIIEYKGELYICGRFKIDSESEFIGFAKWDGSQWIDVMTQYNNFNGVLNISDFAVYQDELYMIGFIPQIDSISFNKIAKWDGENWDNLREGIDFLGIPLSLSVFRNRLYIGGLVFSPNSTSKVYSLISWNNSSFESVPQFDNSLSEISAIRELTTFGNKMFISSNSGEGKIYSFDGLELIKIDAILDDDVSSMLVHNQELYVAGRFGQFNNLNGVARLKIENTAPASTKLYELYPNPAFGNITLKYNVSTQNNTHIKLLDMTGHCVFEKLYRDEKGDYIKKVSLPKLNPGVYYLQFQQGDKKETQKVVLVN